MLLLILVSILLKLALILPLIPLLVRLLLIRLQELNRIHKAAVSTGFHQLLTSLSKILERECALLPSTAHPDAAMQLQHAASLLTNKEVLSTSYIIQPLNTNFGVAGT